MESFCKHWAVFGALHEDFAWIGLRLDICESDLTKGERDRQTVARPFTYRRKRLVVYDEIQTQPPPVHPRGRVASNIVLIFLVESSHENSAILAVVNNHAIKDILVLPLLECYQHDVVHLELVRLQIWARHRRQLSL
jgi:hypothetical protein